MAAFIRLTQTGDRVGVPKRPDDTGPWLLAVDRIREVCGFEGGVRIWLKDQDGFETFSNPFEDVLWLLDRAGALVVDGAVAAPGEAA